MFYCTCSRKKQGHISSELLGKKPELPLMGFELVHSRVLLIWYTKVAQLGESNPRQIEAIQCNWKRTVAVSVLCACIRLGNILLC